MKNRLTNILLVFTSLCLTGCRARESIVLSEETPTSTDSTSITPTEPSTPVTPSDDPEDDVTLPIELSYDNFVSALDRTKKLTNYTLTSSYNCSGPHQNTKYGFTFASDYTSSSVQIISFETNKYKILEYSLEEHTLDIEEICNSLNMPKDYFIGHFMKEKYEAYLSTRNAKHNKSDVYSLNAAKTIGTVKSRSEDYVEYGAYLEADKQWIYFDDDDFIGHYNPYALDSSDLFDIYALDGIEDIVKNAVNPVLSNNKILFYSTFDDPSTSYTLEATFEGKYIKKCILSFKEDGHDSNLTIEFSGINTTSISLPNYQMKQCVYKNHYECPSRYSSNEKNHQSYCLSCCKFIRPCQEHSYYENTKICRYCEMNCDPDRTRYTPSGFERTSNRRDTHEYSYYIQLDGTDSIIYAFYLNDNYDYTGYYIPGSDGVTFYCYREEKVIVKTNEELWNSSGSGCYRSHPITISIFRNVSDSLFDVFLSMNSTDAASAIGGELWNIEPNANLRMNYSFIKHNNCNIVHNELNGCVTENQYVCSDCHSILSCDYDEDHNYTRDYERDIVIDQCHTNVTSICSKCYSVKTEIIEEHSNGFLCYYPRIDGCHTCEIWTCMKCNKEVKAKSIVHNKNHDFGHVFQKDDCTTISYELCYDCGELLSENTEIIHNYVSAEKVNKVSVYEYGYPSYYFEDEGDILISDCSVCHQRDIIQFTSAVVPLNHNVQQFNFLRYSFSTDYDGSMLCNRESTYSRLDHFFDASGKCCICGCKKIEFLNYCLYFRYCAGWEFILLFENELDYTFFADISSIDGYTTYDYTNTNGLNLRVTMHIDPGMDENGENLSTIRIEYPGINGNTDITYNPSYRIVS